MDRLYGSHCQGHRTQSPLKGFISVCMCIEFGVDASSSSTDIHRGTVFKGRSTDKTDEHHEYIN